jgi:hypothetical protein
VNLGHWKLGHRVTFKENAFGFIYEIQNLVTKRKYIGKKQCITTLKRPPLKGKKNKRHEIKETDWKSYTGSSVELNEDIVKHGKENFEFTILHFCDSKWELGYREIKEQIEKDVILREEYYNGILNVRIGSPPKNFIDNKK